MSEKSEFEKSHRSIASGDSDFDEREPEETEFGIEPAKSEYKKWFGNCVVIPKACGTEKLKELLEFAKKNKAYIWETHPQTFAQYLVRFPGLQQTMMNEGSIMLELSRLRKRGAGAG